MSQTLLRLLAAADVRIGERSPRWGDLLLVDNVAAIPALDAKGGDYIWNRGFNIVVLGDDRRPLYFCKCRPIEDKVAWAQTRLLERLAEAEQELAGALPSIRGVQVDKIQIQVARHVEGTRFDARLAEMSNERFIDAVRGVLETAERVCSAAERHLPTTLAGSEVIDVGAEAAPTLAYMTRQGFDPAVLNRIERTLSTCGTLPALVQHGDLWLKNILQTGTGWCLLDFELFGKIRVPLYDACHLARSCIGARRPGCRRSWTWLEQMRAADGEGEALRAVLAETAKRHGISSDKAVACLLYYALDITARSHRRGVRRHFADTNWSLVERLAAHDDELLSAVFFAARSAPEPAHGPVPRRPIETNSE